jgi:hypothetical protein
MTEDFNPDETYRKAEQLAHEALELKVKDNEAAISVMGQAIFLLEKVINQRGKSEELLIEYTMYNAEKTCMKTASYKQEKRFFKAYRTADDGLTLLTEISDTLNSDYPKIPATKRANELMAEFYDERVESLVLLDSALDARCDLQNKIDMAKHQHGIYVRKGQKDRAGRLAKGIRKMEKDLIKLNISSEQ